MANQVNGNVLNTWAWLAYITSGYAVQQLNWMGASAAIMRGAVL